MRKITSVTLKQISWGYQSGESDSEHRLNVYRKGYITHSIFNAMEKEPLRKYRYKVCKSIIEEFFARLQDEIKIEDWNEDYSVPVCDGYCWELKLRYSDHRIRKYTGSVDPPPLGDILEQRILKLAEFDERPWMF